jgi:hypothetical protein
MRKWTAGISGVTLLSLLACGGTNGIYGVDHQGSNNNGSTEGSGFIKVSVSTAGGSPSLHYTLTVSNGDKFTLASNDSLTYHTSRLGTHELQLYPVPMTCTLSGANPSVVSVHQAETVHVHFAINCEGGQ